MKRIFGLLLLLAAFNVSAIEINSKLSGVWWNPNQSGHGLNIVMLDENTTLVYWYTYRPDGTSTFLITVGQNEGNRTTGNTYITAGMKFGEFDPNDIQQSVWGTSTVTFSDCNTASISYSSDEPGYGSGTIPMERLASVDGLKCSDSRLHGNYHATWRAGGGEIGYGITSLYENGDMAFGAESDTSGEVGIGEWWVTGSNTFSFQGYSYSVFGNKVYISGSGVFSEDDMEADYTGGGRLFATPVQSFQHSLTTEKLAGTYSVYDWDEVFLGTVTIQNDGMVTGSTTDGCVIDGILFVPNTSFNQAYVDASISNCGDPRRILGGAIYRNALNEIVIAAADGTFGYAWTLKK